MDIKQEFGIRVRELRSRAGISQARLAEFCGRGFLGQNIGEVERGERNCTLQTVDRLAKALKCEPAALFLFDPSKVKESLSLLDSRMLDFWKGADERTKRKAVRILSELL